MRPLLSRSHLGVLVGSLTLLAACGTDPGNGGGGGTAAIAISLSATSLTVQQGASGTLTATITRSGGFSGAVNIATEGAPTGVTAATSNVVTTGGTTTGTVTVTVAASVAPGTYNLTIRATGSGVSDKTLALSLIVTAAPVASIGLTVTPTSLSLAQGAAGSAAVAIARTNFAGDVAFVVEGLPAGMTGSFAPAATATNSSTLSIQVGAAVAVGPYPLTIRGTGTGITAATTTLTVTVVAPAAFTIATIAPDPLSVAQGAAGNATVTLGRTNFAGDINLTVEGLPTGVTGVFAPAAATATTSTLTLTVGAAVVPNNYTLTVRGAATGLTDQTRTFVLTVTAAVQGTYTLSTTPPTQLSIQQGGSTNVTVNINRLGGFVGTVALTVTGAPAGLTVGFTPADATGATSTLAVQATGGLAVGAYPLVIRGTTAGLVDQTVNLTVNVTAPSGGGNVTLNFSTCDVADRPLWVAAQDGNGVWTQVVGNNNVYNFNVGSSRGGFAFVLSPTVSSFAVTVQYYTQAEILGIAPGSYCSPDPATKSLMATVAGLSAGQSATLSLGGGSGSAFANGAVTINGVRNGTFDLLGYARNLLAPGTGERVVVRRGINTAALAANASIGTPVDFATEGVAAASGAITVTNAAGGETLLPSLVYYVGAACDAAFLSSSTPAGSSFTVYGVPAGLQVAGEAHSLTLTATGGGSTARFVLESFTAMGARSITLPTALPVFTPTVEAGAYKRLRTQYTLPGDLNATVGLFYSDAGGDRVVTIGSSVAYLGGTAVDIATPDFSAVAGWNNTWAPTTGSTVSWVASGTSLGAAGAGCLLPRIASSSRNGMI